MNQKTDCELLHSSATAAATLLLKHFAWTAKRLLPASPDSENDTMAKVIQNLSDIQSIQ